MITEKELVFRNYIQHGIGENGRYEKVYWACTLISNSIKECTRDRLILKSDCGTIKIESIDDLKKFEQFDQFIGTLLIN